MYSLINNRLRTFDGNIFLKISLRVLSVSPIFALPKPTKRRDKFFKTYAEVAQLVEHHLAKVRVAGSSLVFRS